MFGQNPFYDAFGLDIGDLSIKLVQLEKSSHLVRMPSLGFQPYYKIKEVRSIKLPPGYIVNGEIQQPENVRKKLLHLLGKDNDLKPIKSPWTVVDLPEPKTFLKLIEVDSLPEELTDDDILFQAKKHLPFDLEEAYLDWQIINKEEKNQNSKVLIGAVPKIIADSYTYLLESAELTPAALEIEAMSISRAMITANKQYTGEARAILDVGATRSSLIIYDRDTIQFSTNLDFSGELLTTAIAQGLKMEHSAAETLKLKNGLAYDKNHPKYLKLVNNLTDKLIDDIKKTINFYQGHFIDTNPITHITMCGGVAATKGLTEEISKKIKVSAKPGNAWKNLNNKHFGEADREKGLGFSSAIGLALRAAQNPF